MDEIWKDIEGYEGMYQVSNLGRVKSLSNSRTRHEKILVPIKNKGYFYVRLFQSAKCKRVYIHTLVASAFIPNPYWKIQCKLPPKTKRFCPLVLK